MLAHNRSLPDAVQALVADLSPDFLERFVRLLRAHESLADITPVRIMREANNDAARDRLCKLIRELPVNPDTAPRVLALGIECALKTARYDAEKQSVDVVWTGPLITPVSLRRSAAVLLELIQGSQREIVIISFAAFRIPDALRALELCAARGVVMHFILESEEESDGRLRQNGSVAFRSLVGVPRVYFYVWPHAKRPPGALLHAKAVIVDGHTALVTSANMTESAISANIEIGLLIRGGDAPIRIHDHVKALIAAGEFAITVPKL